MPANKPTCALSCSKTKVHLGVETPRLSLGQASRGWSEQPVPPPPSLQPTGSPTWQSPDEGEQRVLQAPPKDGQPLLQLHGAHFSLTFGAVNSQGGPFLRHGDGHHMLLAVTDLDLHQGEGDILHSQDDQLQGRSTPEHPGVAGGCSPATTRCALSWAGGPLPFPMPCALRGGRGLLWPGGITVSHRAQNSKGEQQT